MHPVPVQKSTMRSGAADDEDDCEAEDSDGIPAMRSATPYTQASVSGRGIRMPGRHSMSRGPKGCDPRTYCSGMPRRPRCSHRWAMRASIATFLTPLAPGGDDASERKTDGEGEGEREGGEEGDDAVESTCSRIHRSSLRADARSRHAGSRAARCGEMQWARRRREGGRRGINLLVWWLFGLRLHVMCYNYIDA